MPKSKSSSSSDRNKRNDAPYDKDRRMKEDDMTPCRLVEQTMLKSSTPMTLLVLPNGPLVLCFEFLGWGRYRFIAGTCRRFRKQYLKVERQKRTFWKRAALSVSLAELCLQDHELLARLERQEALARLAFVATANGRLGLVHWAHGRGLDLATANQNNQKLVDIAMIGAHIPTIEYLPQVGCEFTPWHCEIAVRRQNLPLLHYLHQHGCDWNARVFGRAVDIGNLEVVQYLHENGCDKNEEHVVILGASRGHLHVLQYLFEDAGFDLATHSEICSASAIRGGHIEILRYLAQEGVVIHGLNCLSASGYGQLEALQYSVENCIEWNDPNDPLPQSCLAFAAENGHDHIVQWIQENS